MNIPDFCSPKEGHAGLGESIFCEIKDLDRSFPIGILDGVLSINIFKQFVFSQFFHWDPPKCETEFLLLA